MLVDRLRRWPSMIPTLDERFVFAGTACTERLLIAGSMLGLRCRRWASIVTTLGEHFVSCGLISRDPQRQRLMLMEDVYISPL